MTRSPSRSCPPPSGIPWIRPGPGQALSRLACCWCPVPYRAPVRCSCFAGARCDPAGSRSARARPCPIGRELTVLVIATPSLLAPGPQRGDFFLEVGERLEPPVDGGKPQVRHLVKLAERAENSQAHLV